VGLKTEQLMEKTKHEVEDIGNQKKQMASEMLEEQAKKTGDAIWSTKSELETAAVGGAMDAKHTAIDSLDEEFGKAEKAVDSTIEQASAAVDTKMKEADKFVEEKREQVEQVVKDTTQKVADTKDQASASILGKAKGVLNCKYGLMKG
jgi:ABC-type transporter Mla subunit MlaD